jgi:ribonuclease HII
MLLPYLSNWPEAGCDEAGRGCLAGPVFAAAVILPQDYKNELLNDSKVLKRTVRDKLREEIEKDAISFAVSMANEEEIDSVNILQASIISMHRALDKLRTPFNHIIIDGNKFLSYKNIPHSCIIKGDGKFMSIAAASVLAKTYRDEYMGKLHEEYPDYQWLYNKGYPTEKHRDAIRKYGISPYHRKSFALLPRESQLSLF